MSILQDIMDLTRDMTRVGEDITTDTLAKKRYSSVTRRAKEGVLEFPILASRSIPLEEVLMISKALEREFATILQTVLTMSPFLNLSTDKDAAGYLRRFHQNTGVRQNLFNDSLNTLGAVGESTTTSWLDKFNQRKVDYTTESVNEAWLNNLKLLGMLESEEGEEVPSGADETTEAPPAEEEGGEADVGDVGSDDVGGEPADTGNSGYADAIDAGGPAIDDYESQEELEEKLGQAMEFFSVIANGTTSGIQEALALQSKSPFDGVRMEGTLNDVYSQQTALLESGGRGRGGGRGKGSRGQRPIVNKNTSTTTTDARGASYTNKISSTGDIINNYNIKGGPSGGGSPLSGDFIKYELPRNVFVDSAVNKPNELVGTTMHVRTLAVDRNSTPVGHMDFMIGVKGKVHPIDSDDMVTNIADGIRRRGKFFKFVRWSSGEIEFVKDFLFNVSEIKEDVVKSSKGNNSRWWSLLKRRRKISNIRRWTFLPGDVLPNTSLVLSSEEVDYLRNTYNIDMESTKFVDKLMDYYFLLGVVIVDSATGTAKFFFDGDRDYRTITYSGLERGDIGGRGADLKDVIKLVQRV